MEENDHAAEQQDCLDCWNLFGDFTDSDGEDVFIAVDSCSSDDDSCMAAGLFRKNASEGIDALPAPESSDDSCMAEGLFRDDSENDVTESDSHSDSDFIAGLWSQRSRASQTCQPCQSQPPQLVERPMSTPTVTVGKQKW